MTSGRERGEVHELPTDLVVGRYTRLAVRIIERRRARRRLLPRGMLVDVAWDILLHLLAHRTDPAQGRLDAVAAATDLSPTVAIRWLSLLQADALVQYRNRPEGGSWELAGPFLARMIAYLRDNYPDEV